MSEIVPNHYSLQVDWDGYAVTLCDRPECRKVLRTRKVYASRERMQETHDREEHWYSTEFKDGNCLYVLSCEADDQEHQTRLATESYARLQHRKKTAFPSTSFVKRARSSSKPRQKSELYEPTGIKVGAMVEFTKRETPVYKRIDHGGWATYEVDYYEQEEHFTGQVWSEDGPRSHPKSMWVVTDDQRAFVVHKETLNAVEEWKRDTDDLAEEQ